MLDDRETLSGVCSSPGAATLCGKVLLDQILAVVSAQGQGLAQGDAWEKLMTENEEPPLDGWLILGTWKCSERQKPLSVEGTGKLLKSRLLVCRGVGDARMLGQPSAPELQPSPELIL